MILDTEDKNSEKGESEEKQPESPTSTSEKKKSGGGKEDPPPEKNEKDPFNLNLNPLFPNFNRSGGTSFPPMNYGFNFNPMMWNPYMGFPNYYNYFYGKLIELITNVYLILR